MPSWDLNFISSHFWENSENRRGDPCDVKRKLTTNYGSARIPDRAKSQSTAASLWMPWLGQKWLSPAPGVEKSREAAEEVFKKGGWLRDSGTCFRHRVQVDKAPCWLSASMMLCVAQLRVQQSAASHRHGVTSVATTLNTRMDLQLPDQRAAFLASLSICSRRVQAGDHCDKENSHAADCCCWRTKTRWVTKWARCGGSREGGRLQEMGGEGEGAPGQSSFVVSTSSAAPLSQRLTSQVRIGRRHQPQSRGSE